MGNIPLELVETGEQRDTLGRKRTPAERRAQLVQAFKQSGRTMAAFAAGEGVNYTTFAGWVTQSRRPGRPRKPAVRFVQVQRPMVSTPLEVQLADGMVLRGGSATELAALVKALRS